MYGVNCNRIVWAYQKPEITGSPVLRSTSLRGFLPWPLGESVEVTPMITCSGLMASSCEALSIVCSVWLTERYRVHPIKVSLLSRSGPCEIATHDHFMIVGLTLMFMTCASQIRVWAAKPESATLWLSGFTSE